MTGRPADGAPTLVRRVNGPLVDVDGLPGEAGLFDLVAVGRAGLTGEVVALRPDRARVQVHEYTGGLRPGDPVRWLARPLSAPLGPGLLGGVFDGLLRPLSGGPRWLRPGAAGHGAAPRSWAFTPAAHAGDDVGAGTVLGTVPETVALAHPIVVPPGTSGRLEWIHPAGEVTSDEHVAVVAGADVPLVGSWPVRVPRPYRRRLDAAVPLVTGQRVLDLLEPVAKGSNAAVIGGFGTGKTMLLQQIAKWCDADVIVYVGCGERGNELSDTIDDLGRLEDPRTGRRLAERTVIVGNTSNMPVMAREASIHTGMTVAEYYRDLGYDAVVIADSTSRWAEALREYASRAGELPAEEGYPAGLASALAAFYERAGRVETLGGAEASVTLVASVSPPGGDLTEPVSAHTQRFVRCLWALDRDLAYARHYPAVTWRSSFSRDAAALGGWHAQHGDPGWARRRARLEAVLAEADRLESVAELVGLSALPGRERVVLLTARLVREAVLQQNGLSATDAHCSPGKQAALADAVLAVHDRCQELVAAAVPASIIEETDLGPLIRARDAVGPDDAAGVVAVADGVLAALEARR
ncbi:MAG: V-type ATP synthase subunit A [Acidimicrobiales bacterium]|nr:V-type ATP synthase subunit A [Acidimicrobiales bacterium]